LTFIPTFPCSYLFLDPQLLAVQFEVVLEGMEDRRDYRWSTHRLMGTLWTRPHKNGLYKTLTKMIMRLKSKKK
jgi:hypothetical protein